MIDFWFSIILAILYTANIVVSIINRNWHSVIGWGTALLLILMIIGRNT